jgi:hypothetical protein
LFHSTTGERAEKGGELFKKSKMTSSTQIRKYILLSLTKLERRDGGLTPENISSRVRDAFGGFICIVVAKETTKNVTHVGILNNSVPKKGGKLKIRKRFPECNCSIQFSKGLGSLCSFLINKEKEPFVWGEPFSVTSIKRIAILYKLHKRISFEFRDPFSVKTIKETEKDAYIIKYKKPFLQKKEAKKHNHIGRYFLWKCRKWPVDFFFHFITRGFSYLHFFLIYFLIANPTFDWENLIRNLAENFVFDLIFEFLLDSEPKSVPPGPTTSVPPGPTTSVSAGTQKWNAIIIGGAITICVCIKIFLDYKGSNKIELRKQP